MMDTLIMFAITTVVTLIFTVFWRWVSSISKVQDNNTTQIREVAAIIADLRAEFYRDYQSKADSRHDNERILEMLREIKADVSKLADKLDKKADK